MSDDDLRALVERIAAFHITDRAMRDAQKKIEAALAAGVPDEYARSVYLHAARRYFAGFEKEARAHLQEVDKRLQDLAQVSFNLTAERGVAIKRIEATGGVLQDLERVEAQT